MKSNFTFQNLLGSVYKQGNLVFCNNGNTVCSPIGNRLSIFNLTNNTISSLSYQHRRDIVAFDLNSQETLLLSIDSDGRAILCNFKAKSVIHHFNFNSKCQSIKFSPDGQLFAVATGNTLQVWKAPNSSDNRQFAPFIKHKSFSAHFQDITSISWSSDNRFLLSSSKDLSAKLWDISNEDSHDKITMTFAGHRDFVLGAFFSNDQQQIFTVSKDGALFVWEYNNVSKNKENGNTMQNVQTPQETNYSWRITKKHFFYMDEVKLNSVYFHSKSNLLVTGFSNGEFKLYDIPQFTMLQQLSMTNHPINTISINDSGDWIALGSSSLGQLLVYEWKSESFILKQQSHFNTINCLTYSPDGSRVVTATQDGKIKVWDVNSGFCLVTFDQHTSGVTQVRFSKKKQILFSASLDGTIRAWDLIRYRNFRTFTAPQRIQFSSLAIDPSAEVVCAGSQDDFNVYVWSVQTGQLLDTLSGHTGPISCLDFSQGSNGILASASWDKTIRIWSIFARSQQVDPIEIYSDVLALSLRPDGKEVAVSTLQGQISIFDVTTSKQLHNIDCTKDILVGRFTEDRFTAKTSQRGKFFSTIDYSFDGTSIIAGGDNNSICLYDVTNEVLLKRFTVSNNIDLNGTLQFLNSNRMTDAGSLDLVDESSESSDLKDRLDVSLPGVKSSTSAGTDFSSKTTKAEVRVTSIQFSPSADAFAAASTEGLLIYSVNNTVIFDPFDLDVNITPKETLQMLSEKQYLDALVMAFRLNETYLINKVYEAVPVNQIPLVTSNIPTVYLPRIVQFIGEFAIKSQHIEFNLIWIKNLFAAQGSYIQLHRHIFATGMRTIQRFLERIAKDVVNVSASNKYTYRFLTSTDGSTIKPLDGSEDDVQVEDALDTSDEETGSDFETEQNSMQLDQKENKILFSSSDEESSDEE